MGFRGIILILFFVLTWTSVCQAQRRKKRWQVHPSLSFYEHYSDNIELSCDSCGDPVSGFKTEIVPSVSFLLPSKRRQIRIDFNARMDYRTRSNDTDKALYWLDFDTYLGHELSPRTSYEMVLGYDITYTNAELGTPFVDAFSALTRATVLEFAPGIRYRLGKKTLTKFSFSYLSADYASEDAVNSTEMAAAGYIERKFGTRLNIDVGLIYTSKVFSYPQTATEAASEANYDEIEIPFTIILNLTYFKLTLSSSYYVRQVEPRQVLEVDQQQIQKEQMGDGSQILWSLGFDLGGKLFKLRKTTFKITMQSNIKDDMYGRAYIAQLIKLQAFHVLKKFDIYNEIKYGNNEYVGVDESTSFYGAAASFKWLITKKKNMEGRVDYTTYNYEGEIPGTYTIITGEVNYGHQMRDWLYIGIGIGRRQSSSDIDEGNYTENFMGFFAKANW